jgi:metallo-beta-lactamase class B
MSTRFAWAALGLLCAVLDLPPHARASARPQTKTLEPDPPISCGDCATWNAPHEPFVLFGNTYFVGPADLSALLVVTRDGLVLVDGALPQSAAVIDRNIRALGFKTTDVTFILTSHAHYDHAGGLGALQRYTGATVLASAAGAKALAQGYPTADDPQYAGPKGDGFPTVSKVRVVADKEALTVGGVTFTPQYTPGHTPGATSWTWKACEGARCLDFVYGDSLTPISNKTYRYTGGAGQPDVVERFRASIARMASLPCDILVTTHPSASGFAQKTKGRRDKGLAPGAPGDPFVEPGACKAYAARASKALDERVRTERGLTPGRFIGGLSPRR